MTLGFFFILPCSTNFVEVEKTNGKGKRKMKIESKFGPPEVSIFIDYIRYEEQRICNPLTEDRSLDDISLHPGPFSLCPTGLMSDESMSLLSSPTQKDRSHVLITSGRGDSSAPVIIQRVPPVQM